MIFKQLGFAAVAMTAAAALATQAGAQATAPLMLTGPVPAGLCSINGDRAIGESTAGKFMASRMQELGAQVKAELEAAQAPIQTDAQALESQKATLSGATYQSRMEALQQRAAALQRTAQVRQRELQDTEGKAVQTIEQQLFPIIQQTAISRHCSLVFNAGALILGNPSIDLTDAAMASLNVKLTSFAIEREHLDQQPGAR
jgi:outer membrane protein